MTVEAQTSAATQLQDEWESLVHQVISVGGEEDEETQLWLIEVGAMKKLKPPGPEEPVYPRDVTALSTEALGQLYDELGNWHDFYQSEVAALRGHAQRAKEALNVTESFLKTRIMSGPVTQRKDEVKSRPEYVQLLAHLLRTKHLHQTATASLTRFGNMVRRLSRHVAMRLPALAGLLGGGYPSASPYTREDRDDDNEDDERQDSYSRRPAQGGGGFRLPKLPGQERNGDG